MKFFKCNRIIVSMIGFFFNYSYLCINILKKVESYIELGSVIFR